MKTKQMQKNIPVGWQEVRLGDLGDFSKGAGISRDDVRDTGYNAVRYGELYTRYDFQIKRIYSHIPREVIAASKLIKYGDILFASSGETIDEIGKSAAYLLREDCYAGGDIIVFTPNGADSLFLSYFLNVGEARKKLRELGQGQSVVHIYKRDLEKLNLHLPPLEEQRRIVGVLEVWDKAIEKLSKKILKKNIKNGLMQQLLTGKKRLPDFSDRWKFIKLGEICDIKTGDKNNQDKVNHGNYPFFVRSPIVEKIDSYSFDGEAILVPGEGNIGKIFHYINGRFDYHQRVYKISDFKRNISSKYVYYYFIGNFLKQAKSDSAKATVDSLRLPTFKNFIINLPSYKEQTAIANILTTADNEIAGLEKRLLLLKDQKKYLLNNLITGEILTPENLAVKELEVSLC